MEESRKELKEAQKKEDQLNKQLDEALKMNGQWQQKYNDLKD